MWTGSGQLAVEGEEEEEEEEEKVADGNSIFWGVTALTRLSVPSL